MRGAIEKDIIPRFGTLVDNIQQQKSYYRLTYFLNLLCALPCVIFSAHCNAIVFLHVNVSVAFCLISNFKRRVLELATRFFGVHHNEKG